MPQIILLLGPIDQETRPSGAESEVSPLAGCAVCSTAGRGRDNGISVTPGQATPVLTAIYTTDFHFDVSLAPILTTLAHCTMSYRSVA